MKIYLNNVAQEMLFGYFEGVDWHLDLSDDNPNSTNSTDRYILKPKKEQDRIYNKVTDWIHNYRKKYNGKFSDIDIDDEIAFYLSSDSENQKWLIVEEIFGNNVEDIFEYYWCNKSKREKKRVKAGKEQIYKDYKLAEKQLAKLEKIQATI